MVTIWLQFVNDGPSSNALKLVLAKP